MRSASLLLLALAVGCGVTDETELEPGGGKEDRLAGASLRFTGDFAEELAGALRAGETLRVRYALERLPQCRGTSGGRPQWTITGFYSVDGAAARSFDVSRVEGDDRVPVEVAFTVPDGRDLAFWFQVSNRWGCTEFDSDFGANYHFGIGAGGGGRARIAFDAGGGVQREGTLRGGGRVVVSYALDRLPDCRGTSGGLPQWSITGFAQVDDGKTRTFEVSRVEGDDRVPVDAELELPRGRALGLWFQVTNRWGCTAFDSNQGANYTFAVEQD